MTYNRCRCCGQGQFKLMAGSNYQWQCDHCGRISLLKVIDAKSGTERVKIALPELPPEFRRDHGAI